MSESIEFSISTDLTPLRNFDIQANFEECKAWLDKNLAPYRTMVVTEDGIAPAKKYRASIRAASARIDECRKMAKEAAMQSYKPFEEKCKALTALCDESAANLDGQIKAFDEAKKAEKGERLRAFFNQSIGEMNDFLTFDAIYNPRWMNATYSEEQARKDIICEIAKCSNAVESLRALHSEFETTLLDEFRRTHDLAACLKRNENLLRIKEIEETRKRMRLEQEQDVANKLAAARTAEAPAPKPVEPTETEKPRETAHTEQTEETPQMFELVFRVRGTAEQLNGLKQYMKENGIQFGRADG
jgi:hypothetical protein